MGLNDTDEPAPFQKPFLFALLFGLPFVALTLGIAFEKGLILVVVNSLMGVACSYGARIAARGWHPAMAAMAATSMLLVFDISALTLMVIAADLEISPVDALGWIFTDLGFTGFCNACVFVGGKTVIRYPIALYLAYQVSDGS